MDARRRRRGAILGYLVTIGYAVWALYYVPRAPQDERLFGAVICSIFFLFYLVPFYVLGANVEIQEKGIQVEQFDVRFLDFSQIRACFPLFLVPFRIGVLITRERFPKNLLVIFAPGENFVKTLRSKIAQPKV